MYYLQSRYYDPEIGRFINADNYTSTGQGLLGYNMFAYCRNNPVCRKDASGTDDVRVTDNNDDDNPLNDAGTSFRPGGAGGGGNSSSGIGSTRTAVSPSGHTSSAVNNFLSSNGQNPEDILKCFKGDPQLQTLAEDTTVYRTWGGTTPEYGHWVSPYNYGEEARSLLSLPPGNTMTNTSTFVIPKGTTVLVGIAAPYFDQPGGGVQWWVSRVG